MSATVANSTYVAKQTDASSGSDGYKSGLHEVLFTVAVPLRMKGGIRYQ